MLSDIFRYLTYRTLLHICLCFVLHDRRFAVVIAWCS